MLPVGSDDLIVALGLGLAFLALKKRKEEEERKVSTVPGTLSIPSEAMKVYKPPVLPPELPELPPSTEEEKVYQPPVLPTKLAEEEKEELMEQLTAGDSVDVYNYVRYLLYLCLDNISKQSVDVCRTCYDTLAYVRTLVDMYADVEKRMELVSLYNYTLSKTDELCPKETKEVYDQTEQIVELSPSVRYDSCKSYVRSVAEWWVVAGYPRNVEQFLKYFEKLEGAKECLNEFFEKMVEIVKEVFGVD